MAHQDVTWFVAADGGKARILTRHDGRMTTISQFDSAGHGDTAENDTAEIGHIHAPGSDPHAQVKTLFARQVAEHLNRAVEAHQVTEIVLAAPAHVLSAIRDSLSKAAGHALSRSLSKDLTNTPELELASHFD